VYRGAPGGPGVLDALRETSSIRSVPLDALDARSIFRCDVVVVGSLKGLPAGRETWRRDMRLFVRCGGGLLLEHDACGHRGWKEQPVLFPEIVVRGLRTSTTNALTPTAASHPIVTGLPKTFRHAYFDHVVLQPGAAGQIVVRDGDDCAVVVAGQIGQGRVVATGTVTGFATFPEGGQGDRAPAGGELRLLMNAIRWLGEARLTALTPAELAARMAEANEAEHAGQAAAPGAEPFTDWYAPTMLREKPFPRRAVTELPGKVFMWWDTRAAYDYPMIRQACRSMKLLGVTEVMYIGQSGAQVAHRSRVKHSKPMWWMHRYQGKDPLMMVLKAAHEEGLNVWIAGHSGEYAPEMCAKDDKGQPYAYGRKRGIDDNLSPALRQFFADLFKEYAERYNVYGNLKGFYYDEVFFNSVDYHGDDVPAFSEYCQREFGEPAPANIVEKLALRGKWVDPTDKWWRRFVLFKAWCNTDFLAEMTKHAHGNGLKMIVELRPAAQYLAGWAFGMNNYELAHIGADYHFVAAGCEPVMVYPNALTGAHEWATWGFYHSYALRGRAEMTFVYGINEYPFISANPHQPERTVQHACNVREWFGAKPLARTCILTNQMALILRHPDPRPAWKKEQNLLGRLSRYQDFDMTLSAETEHYRLYRALLAPAESLIGLPTEALGELRSYVTNGGVVFSLGARWVASRRDLTNQRDLTGEILGGVYEDREVFVDTIRLPDSQAQIAPQGISPFRPRAGDVKVIATFAQGGAAITERAVGKGKIVAFHFDVAKEIADLGEAIEALLARMIADATKPEIRVSGGPQVMTTLRKNNWVAVSLYSEDAPKSCTVHVGIERLGIERPAYRVLLYGRNRELCAPGGYWYPKPWTADQIRDGIRITIPKLGVEHLDFPKQLDLSGFSENEQKWVEAVVPSRWNKHAKLRRWEHEIVVIAPHDELDIEGTKAGEGP